MQLVLRSEKRCQFLLCSAMSNFCINLIHGVELGSSALKLKESCGFSSFYIRKEITRLTLCFSRFNAAKTTQL